MVLKRMYQFIFVGMVLIVFLAQLANQGLMNIVSLGLAVPIIIIAINKIKRAPFFKSDKNMWLISGFFLLINVLLLAYVALNFQINDTSDPLNVQIKAYELIHGNQNWHTSNQEYFYTYPNVVMYTIFLAKVMMVGVHLNIPIQLTLRFMNLLMLIGVSLFSTLAVWQITKKAKSVLISSTILLFYPVMYLYPNLVTYTDTISMFLAALFFYLSALTLTAKKTLVNVLSAVLIIPVFSLMFMFKANMIVLLPAVLALLVIVVVNKMDFKFKTILLAIGIILGLTLATTTTAKIETHYGFEEKSEEKTAVPITHWMNMGLNPVAEKGTGAFDTNDETSAVNAKKDGKTDLITDSIKDRVHLLGTAGLWQQYLGKAQILLGTPLFGYGRYQAGFDTAPLFFIKHQSFFYAALNLLATLCLTLCSVRLLFGFSRIKMLNELNENQLVFAYLVGIASFGLALFHIAIWEVQPRYFLPFLYPLVSLSALTYSNDEIIYPLAQKTTALSLISFSLLGFLSLVLSPLSKRIQPSQAFGNFEYEVRISLREEVKLPKQTSFRLQVPQDIDTLKVNLPTLPGLSVSLSDGSILKPQNNQFILEKHISGGQNVTVHIKNDRIKTNVVSLYSQPNLYKSLYHGSKTKINGTNYYLPYEMDVYDKKPFEPFVYPKNRPLEP